MLKGEVYTPKKKPRTWPDTPDQIDFKRAKRRQKNKKIREFFKRNKDAIIVTPFIIGAIAFAYFMYPILFSD